MNHTSPPGGNRAFTLIELAVVTVVVAILVALVLPALTPHRPPKWQSCVNNLKQVGLAFRIFANDNGGQYPFNVSTTNGGAKELVAPGATFLQFRVMSNELSTPYIVVCPADDRKRTTNWASLTESNISYFVGIDAAETLPSTLLSGDRNLSVNGVAVRSGLLGLTTNSVVGWTAEMHRGFGHVVLGDGSVQQANNASMRGRRSGTSNRLLIP